MTAPRWANSTVLCGDPIEVVRELKAAPGHGCKDVVVTGSIMLTLALIRAGPDRTGPLDEYRIFVYPVVHGRERPLFPLPTKVAALRPARALLQFPSGVTLLYYAAGSVDDHAHERGASRL
ncbi:hypothetical protein BH09ACT8_BH09ACT8_26540 [soil metagenome]